MSTLKKKVTDLVPGDQFKVNDIFVVDRFESHDGIQGILYRVLDGSNLGWFSVAEIRDLGEYWNELTQTWSKFA